MRKQYIKQPIPEAISEDGGASIVFVNKQTVPLDGAITEALAGNYCTGQATLIRNFFFGLMQSMADGVRRDGHARQIANFLTVYPVFKGEIDMDRGYDPNVNGVMIRARLLNEMDLDITDWSFEDVTPGKRSFALTSCSTGEVIGEYRIGEIGHINGKELPSTLMGEEIRVHWELEGTEMSGDIPAAKLSSETDRADIAADALAELASEEYDGKIIVFTVRGNFSSAKISATVKYAEPVPIAQSASGDIKIMEMDAVSASRQWNIRGLNVGLSNEDEPNGIVSASAEIEGKTVDWASFATHFEDASATFKPSGTTDLPPGEYVADLTFLRVGGSEGGEEIVVHDVTITVP